jgi:hypothetical protein
LNASYGVPQCAAVSIHCPPTEKTSAVDRPPAHKTTAKAKKNIVKELFGYEATLLVNGSTHPVDDRIAPPVVVGGYTLERPGHRPGGAAVDVLRQATANGWPTGLLAADRAYNNSDPDTFQLRARALGFDLLFDYRDDQLGIQAEHAGAVQVEGRWHCPHMPTALIDATRDVRDHTIDEQTWQQRLTARHTYELRPKANPDHEGHQRMLCPAAGDAPTVRCPLKKPSMRFTAKPTGLAGHQPCHTACCLSATVGDDSARGRGQTRPGDLLRHPEVA